MEPDFVTRQHLDSLTPSSDPDMAEVLGKYKFPPATRPPRPPRPMGGYGQPAQFSAPSSNNDMLLGSMLGQLQANQNQNQTKNSPSSDGFQLSINTEILRWLLLIVLLVVLIWLVLQVRQNKKNSAKSELRNNLSRKPEFRRFRSRSRSKRKNPKELPFDEISWPSWGQEDETEDAWDEPDDDF
mgnify:CR=1 FL=1|jgi:hypothetical protein